METKVLDFKEKVESITIDELKQSVEASEVGGYSRVLPVEHYQLWDDIQEKLDKKNLGFKAHPLYCAGGKNARRIKRLEEQLGKNALGATWLQKVIGKISITNLANDESTGSLGIAFHDKGIQVSYGQNIHVCDNFSILNPSNTVKTFGQNKIDNYKNMLQIIDSWIATCDDLRKQDMETIKIMKELSIENSEIIPELIGKLEMKAVKASYMGGEMAPFNIGQVSTFTRNYMEATINSEVNNLWELYNHGTNIMKPNIVDISSLQPQIISFTEFLKEEFSLN